MLHEALWRANSELASACLAHSFVRALGDGTLDRGAFSRYVAQDAFFLRAYAKAYALALARSEDSETAEVFRGLLNGAFDELKMHAAYARTLGIDLERVTPNAACRAYTDFLLRTAWHGSPGEIVAAMTPCMRLYAFLGRRIADGRPPEHPYKAWIATYSSEDFEKLASRLESLLDRVASATPEVEDAYRYALECELAFFSEALG